MRLNISYRAPSKAAARMWLNSIKSKIRRYRDAFPHNLEYSYEIPEQFIYILTEVYRLIRNQDKTVSNVSDWFQEYFIRRFGTASDSAGVILSLLFLKSNNKYSVILTLMVQLKKVIKPMVRLLGLFLLITYYVIKNLLMFLSGYLELFTIKCYRIPLWVLMTMVR